ncbi:hypothetical protein FQ762_00670 [Streptomyces coelicolor A3(2)]|nr:hypothetical protein FQ762_00670 [Streptomyces coelicolor A3(2)]
MTAAPWPSGAMAPYRRRRDEHGDWHAAAQRNLCNRMLGRMFHCVPCPRVPSCGVSVGPTSARNRVRAA